MVASGLKWLGSQRLKISPLVLILSNMGGWLVICLSSWSVWWFLTWATQYNLIIAEKPVPPTWTHPIWSLVERLPEDAVPVVDKKTSIAVSNFEYSYTYDESLYNKSPRKGLQVATHLIFDQRREKVLEWISNKPGYEVIDEEYPFLTITWDRNQRDRSVNARPKFSKVHAWTGMYSKGSDIPGVPPHEKTIKRQQGTIPVLQLFPHRRPPPR